MKQTKRLASILLAIVMVFSIGQSSAVFAAEDTDDADKSVSLDSQAPYGTIRIDLEDYIEEEEIYIEPTFGDADNELLGSCRKSIDITESVSRSLDANSNTSPQSRNPYNYIDSIPIAGQYIVYGLYTVGAGEMIEAVMYAPATLPVQYELSIYYLSGSTLYQVDFSSLGTGGNVDFESVGIVNVSANPIQYAVVVEALTNGSNTYELTVAISIGFDNHEHNNSVYYSRGYVIPNMTQGQYFSYSGNIHTYIDVDWIRFVIPTNANYSAIHLTENNTANVKYELFQDVGGSLSRMTKGGNGQYSVTPGQTYYYRISAANTGASYPRNYTFEVRPYVPALQTAYFDVSFFVDSNPAPTQTYTNGGNRYAFLGARLLEVYVKYYTSSGALNTTENNDFVTVEIKDTAWNPGAWSYMRDGNGTASGGIACIPVTTGHAYGQVTVQQQYGFFLYDYSVTLTINSAKHGQIASIPVFYTTKIN